jgi:hypothetical protein
MVTHGSFVDLACVLSQACLPWLGSRVHSCYMSWMVSGLGYLYGCAYLDWLEPSTNRSGVQNSYVPCYFTRHIDVFKML